jgi:hypothetical protein
MQNQTKGEDQYRMTDQENLSALNGLHSDTWKYPKLMFLDKYPRCFILLKNRVFEWTLNHGWLLICMIYQTFI